MEKIEQCEFKLIGLKLPNKTTNEGGQANIDCGNLWQKFEKENVAESISGKLSEDIYAVYYNYQADYTKPFHYFIGCRVVIDAVASEGTDQIIIPAGSFFKFLSKGKMPDCMVNSWKDIWNSATNKAYQYDFEVYTEQSKDWNNAAVEIFVSTY